MLRTSKGSTQCPQSFPPAYHRRHQPNRPLTRRILRDQEDHCCACLLRPFPTLFHFLQEFHHFFLRLFRQVQWNFGMKTITANSCFFVVCFCRLCKISFLESWQVLLQSLQLLFFRSLFYRLCTPTSHCQCFAHSFFFSSHLAIGLASSFFLFQDLHSSSPRRRLGDLVQELLHFHQHFCSFGRFFSVAPLPCSLFHVSFSSRTTSRTASA